MAEAAVPLFGTRSLDGTRFWPLGTLGHVSAPTWSTTMPGGADSAQCVLQQVPTFRHPALDFGLRAEIHVGASVIWQGAMAEPVPTDRGWEVTAKGSGTWGDRYRDIWSTWNANDALDQAISRGLRWRKGTIASTGLYLAEPQDSSTQSITEFLNLITKPGAYTWMVDRWRRLSVFPIPTTVTRVLICPVPQARSMTDYINALVARYQVTADDTDTGAVATYGTVIATNPASIAKHDRTESNWDITAAGVLSSGAASGYAATALSQFKAASWAGPITAMPGQYLTTTGVPVNHACETAGQVARLVLTDGPYGGEVAVSPPVTFPVGKTEYDAATGALALTPFAGVPYDLASLLDALSLALPKPPEPTT